MVAVMKSALICLALIGLLLQGNPSSIGSISGRVLDADTNTPLVGVRVDARDRSAGATATTDSQGRYVFEKLPPGNRSIEVYDGNLGPSMTPSQTVTVVGGRDTQVDFHTRLFAEVSGRVLDDDGNPIAGMQVTANFKEYEGYSGRDGQPSRTGEVQLVSRRASGLTDDQGRYVITTLSAGLQYWIVASSPKRYAIPISDAPADPQARKRTLAATYYPSSDSIDTASALILHSQEVRDGVDIRIHKAESYCLEATLTERGVPARMQFLLLETAVSSTRLPSINLPGSFESARDGKIRLCDLYPGRFHLIAARLSSAAQESIAAVDVTITNKDVRDLVVAAIPPSTVSAELVWDKPPVEAASPSIRVRTYPSPVGVNPSLTLPVPGTFSLSVVAGSSYITAISGLDSHSYVKDVTYDGSSILHQPFVPHGGDAKLRITIGSDAGSITATVLAANGQLAAGSAVLIVPVSARTEPDVAAAFLAGITNENGIYSVGGLPPGKYDVFAANNLPPTRVDRDGMLLITRTPDAIGRILRTRARGKQVEVGSGGAASVSLTPIRMD